MSNLYTDEQNLYDITISTDGQTIDYIDPTEGPKEIPDITGHANAFLQVNSTETNIQWTSFSGGGGIPIAQVNLGLGSVTNPSLTFQGDTNTGIFSGGAEDIAITTNGFQRLDINSNIITAGTVSNPISLNVNGSFSSVAITITTGAYSWNNLTSDVYICNTAGGNISINLNTTGTENLGRKIRFYKSNTNAELRFFASGGNVRVNSPLGTQPQPNAGQFTNIPVANGFFCIYEIIRETASNYSLQILEYQNNTDAITFGQIFRAGDGVTGTPSYSFANTTGGTSQGADTGMFYVYDTIDRLRFSAGGTNTLEMNANQSFFNNRLLANATGTNTTPSLIFHNDSSTTGYSGQRTNPSTDPRLWAVVNGVQATELTPTQFNIGLNTLNNTNMKTLNQNGASNFNTFTPSYSSFLLPQTAIGTINQALSGCDFDGTNYVVSVAGTGAGNRLFVSTNLSTWTAITDTQIATGNSQVQFGNGIWCYLTRTSGTRQLWTSTAPATTWTQIDANAPWTTARQVNRLKFINGQFIGLCNTSFIRFSSNGTTWTEYSINATSYNLNDITYSPELQRYIIVTTGTAVLYFSGNTITNTSAFTAVTTNAEAANCCSYSPKYGLFLYHGNTNSQRYYISKDGINWTFYTNPTTVTNSNNTIWINDFGGFFLDMQFNQSQVAVSRDGLSFQTIASNLTMTTVNAVYNSTGKVLLIVGSSVSWGTYRNMLTDFNNYVDSDNIYNTFNSNIRFADTIEYQNQVITPVSGNNHFTISQFNRSEVVFDTTSVNANIYLQGASFNGRVGCKFKFIKSNNNNNVRIHGFETTTLISPTGNVSSFNAQSSPQTYSIIQAGYFGSFELTRVSDTGNGVWVVDNVDVYDSSGTHRDISNLSVAGNLIVDGTISYTGGVDFVGNPRLSSTELRFVNVIDADINVPHFIGAYSGKTTPAGQINEVTLKNLGVNGVGKTFYWFRSTGDVVNECRFTNDSGQDAYVFYWSTVNNREEFFLVPNSISYITHTANTNYSFSWFKFTYMEVANFRRWIVKEIGSGWE